MSKLFLTAAVILAVITPCYRDVPANPENDCVLWVGWFVVCLLRICGMVDFLFGE